MAPEKNKAKVIKRSEKEITLWANCTKSASVPGSYISMFSAERMFGVKYKVRSIVLAVNPLNFEYLFLGSDSRRSDVCPL